MSSRSRRRPYLPEKARVFLSRRESRVLRASWLLETLWSLPGAGLEEGRKLLKLKESYRHRRLFTAYVAGGKKGEAVSDIVAFPRRESEDQALLCCTSYCVVRSGRSFMRTPYQKPLEAMLAGLSWKEVP